MKITVTQQCIDKAQRSGSPTELIRNCLIATAFRETGIENVIVGIETAAVHKEKVGYLPKFVQQAILDFHSGKTIQPFEFDFEFTPVVRSKP